MDPLNLMTETTALLTVCQSHSANIILYYLATSLNVRRKFNFYGDVSSCRLSHAVVSDAIVRAAVLLLHAVDLQDVATVLFAKKWFEHEIMAFLQKNVCCSSLCLQGIPKYWIIVICSYWWSQSILPAKAVQNKNVPWYCICLWIDLYILQLFAGNKSFDIQAKI